MIKTAICYFSGSGNSFDISLELCKHIDVESIFYLPNLDKKKLEKYDEIIIVSPVYKFNIPKPVQDFIRGLTSEHKYYVLLNGGGICGKSKSTVKKLFKEAKANLAFIKFIIMPFSFAVTFVQPQKMINNILKQSQKRISKIAKAILKHENKKIDLHRLGKMNRYIGYTTFSDYLSVDSSCTRCEQCVQMCPTGNIQLYQGNIEFRDKCVSCMGCYNRCESIKYKGKKGKTYTNPNIDFRLMK